MKIHSFLSNLHPLPIFLSNFPSFNLFCNFSNMNCTFWYFILNDLNLNLFIYISVCICAHYRRMKCLEKNLNSPAEELFQAATYTFGRTALPFTASSQHLEWNGKKSQSHIHIKIYSIHLCLQCKLKFCHMPSRVAALSCINIIIDLKFTKIYKSYQ